MNVYVSEPFNKAIAQMDIQLQNEINSIYLFLQASDKDHILSSSFTKLSSSKNEIYTFRGNKVRIFCIFNKINETENIILINAEKINDHTFKEKYEYIIISKNNENCITLFNKNGNAIAYIDNNDENTIYTFNGEPIAYLYKTNIYGFDGTHLGWFENQFIWDHSGKKAGFTNKTCPATNLFEPYKGFKKSKPTKKNKQFSLKPFKNAEYSEYDLLDILKGKEAYRFRGNIW